MDMASGGATYGRNSRDHGKQDVRFLYCLIAITLYQNYFVNAPLYILCAFQSNIDSSLATVVITINRTAFCEGTKDLQNMFFHAPSSFIMLAIVMGLVTKEARKALGVATC